MQNAIQFEIEPKSNEDLALHNLAISQAKRYLRDESDLLNTVMEVDRTRLFLKFDLKSTFAYCQKYLGLSDAVIYNFITVGRKSREIPALKLAVEEQGLTVATARKIVPILNVENQAEWIEKAKTLPKRMLEREVVESAPASAKAQERVTPKKDGLFEVKLYLTKEEHEEFLRVQDLVSQSQQKSASKSEAFVAANKCYLRYKDPLKKAERKRKYSR